MTEQFPAGAVVRPNDSGLPGDLTVAGFIRIERITKGPNKGKIAWSISVPPALTNAGLQAARQGIAQDERAARITAHRALLWHMRRTTEAA